ncbi:hypothetical protein [Campylobacter sp. RM16704]|uniref:hypothetical protein n=1 Tax=Campylobacter sp. RM16704 TaxID=1500960 RepID=UPI00057DE344|nr:hypothetical protein [Campylobacter sp. RM16704]
MQLGFSRYMLLKQGFVNPNSQDEVFYDDIKSITLSDIKVYINLDINLNKIYQEAFSIKTMHF